MIEFYFVIAKMLSTNLTCIIIPSNYAHLNLKWNVSSLTAWLSSFRRALCNKNHGTNMTKNCALHLQDFLWNIYRIVVKIKVVNVGFEYLTIFIIQRLTIS